MIESIPLEITDQVSSALALLQRRLGSGLLAVHLYGSAQLGGLKPHSDIDLLVTLSAPPVEAVGRGLLLDLLTLSAWPGRHPTLRALEVTAVVRSEVVPWRYPPRRELQFGEWLRGDLQAGIFAPALLEADLAILLSQARRSSIALYGPPAAEIFEPVPQRDFFQALADSVRQWNSVEDWSGDEGNIVLTLARIWYSSVTGEIVPKDKAAEWVLPRLPQEYHPVLMETRLAYLGAAEEHLADRQDQVAGFIQFSKKAILDILGGKIG